MPRMPVGSNTRSRPRSWRGSLELQITVIPGPAAMRASCGSPVTIRIGLSPAAPPPAPIITFPPLQPYYSWLASSDISPAPTVERISDTHGSVSRIRGESQWLYISARPIHPLCSGTASDKQHPCPHRDGLPRRLPLTQ